VQVFCKGIWTAGFILKENGDLIAKRPNRLNCAHSGPSDRRSTVQNRSHSGLSEQRGAAAGPRWISPEFRRNDVPGVLSSPRKVEEHKGGTGRLTLGFLPAREVQKGARDDGGGLG
jgi:hypothetical protein